MKNNIHILNIAIKAILEKLPDILAIYVFGSFGTEFERKESDLDLAILPQKKVDTVNLWELSQIIASKINREVQIVDLLSASTVFRHEIITSGRRIYCDDQSQSDFIENVYLSRYLRFNDERIDILNDYRG